MKNGILLKVLLAMALAVLAGWATGKEATLLGVPYVQLFNLIGKLFLNALSLVVVPLIAASIITGTAKMSGEHSFGGLGLKTLGYFVLTSFLAIMVGLVMGLVMAPGASAESLKGMVSSSASYNLAEIQHQVEGGIFPKIEQLFYKIIPSNIVAAASEGQMLGLILFCLLFGFFIPKIERRFGETLIHFWQGVFQVMLSITHLVLRALPIGVFGLVAKAVAESGPESFKALSYFILTVLAGLAIYALVILPLLLKGIAGVNPWRHLRAMFPALVTAFSTSSSAATLPITLECVEKRAGVSNKISSFAIPLGTSINLSGSFLYVCISVLFVAQVNGITLPWPSLALLVLMTLVSSFGSAGIPSASLISILVILKTLGLPEELGLIMSVERFLDMFRTPVNVFGTSCCAVLVAHSEGELGK